MTPPSTTGIKGLPRADFWVRLLNRAGTTRSSKGVQRGRLSRTRATGPPAAREGPKTGSHATEPSPSQQVPQTPGQDSPDQSLHGLDLTKKQREDEGEYLEVDLSLKMISTKEADHRRALDIQRQKDEQLNKKLRHIAAISCLLIFAQIASKDSNPVELRIAAGAAMGSVVTALIGRSP